MTIRFGDQVRLASRDRFRLMLLIAVSYTHLDVYKRQTIFAMIFHPTMLLITILFLEMYYQKELSRVILMKVLGHADKHGDFMVI